MTDKQNAKRLPARRVRLASGRKPWPLSKVAAVLALLCVVAAFSACGDSTPTTPETATGSNSMSSGDVTQPEDKQPGSTEVSSENALKFLLEFIQANPDLKLKDVRYADKPKQWSKARAFQDKWSVEGQVPVSLLDVSALALDAKGFTFLETEHGRAGFVYLKRPIKTTDGGELGPLPSVEWNPTAKKFVVKNFIAVDKEKSPEDPKSEPKPVDPPKEPEILAVALDEVISDYKLDSASAHKRYRGKTLEVKGYVMQTVNGEPPLLLLIGENRSGTAQIELPKNSDELLVTLEVLSGKTTLVTVQGKCVGYNDDLLKLKEGVLVAPTSDSAKKKIEGLLKAGSVADVKAAREHLDLMVRLNITTTEDAKALSSLIDEATEVLALAAQVKWAPVVRRHISDGKYDEAEQAIKSAVADLLDAESEKILRDELAAATAEQRERLAELLSKVRESIVAADYETARSSILEATDSGDLDSATEKALRGEIEIAETVRAIIARGYPPGASMHLDLKAGDLSETVFERLTKEVSDAVAEFDKKAIEVEDSIRQSIIDGEMEAAAKALKQAKDDALLSESVVATLTMDGAATETIRSKLKSDDVLGSRSALKAVKGMSKAVRSILDAEIDAKLTELKKAAKEAAKQTIKLEDGTEVTLDFTCVADTTRVDSVEVTTEDTSGFVQNVYVKVKYTHFAAEKGSEPWLNHTSMVRAAYLGESGEQSLKLEKAKIENKKVVFVLK